MATGGGNASLTAWAQTTLDGAFVYPVNLALARYQTGKTVRHAVLVHYGDDEVTADLPGWFHRYNGRQTIEAGMCQQFWTVRSDNYCSRFRVTIPLPAMANGVPVLVGVKGFASRPRAADP